MIARVRGRDRRLDRDQVDVARAGSTSTNTGVRADGRITLPVATQVSGVVMTSSPGPMPASRSAISIVAVAELRGRTGRPP